MGGEPREKPLGFGNDPDNGSDPGVSEPGWYSGWMAQRQLTAKMIFLTR